LRPEIDLSLLRDNLVELNETSYFSSRLNEFNAKLVEAIDHVLSNAATYGARTVYAFAVHVHHAERYLAGSTIKDAPYELEYCLKTALPRWVTRESLITTALTYAQDFHFKPADPWAFIKTAISGFDTKGFDPLLVLVGLPRLYIHKPLYCIPLYHELGHFVDLTLGVTQLSLLIDPPASDIVRRHRQEHFADLFLSSYVGRTGMAVLEIIAPNAAASPTHPATQDRIAVVDRFLGQQHDPLVQLFQACLRQLGAPSLTTVSRSPDVREAFDDIRPCDLTGEQELHGLLGSAWSYLMDALDNETPPWSKGMQTADIERIVNDLTEKSIRNHSIRERWAIGAIV
jgi:hypothetical protein